MKKCKVCGSLLKRPTMKFCSHKCRAIAATKNRTCDFDGCDKSHHAYGYCSIHFQRWKAHGDATTVLRRTKGSGGIDADGYLVFRIEGKRKLAHVLVAEKAIGKPLPLGAQVHHVNENRLDNRPENLVICPNNAYHKLLHKRMRMFAKRDENNA